MNPRLFLDLAVLYKGGRPTPESYRSAISRAYYAAFNVGVLTLKHVGIHLSEGPQAHGELRDCLGESDDADLVDARDFVRKLHSRRIRADYHMDDPVPEERNEADTACREAKESINIFESLSNDQSKAPAIAAMKRYARDVRHLRVT